MSPGGDSETAAFVLNEKHFSINLLNEDMQDCFEAHLFVHLFTWSVLFSYWSL